MENWGQKCQFQGFTNRSGLRESMSIGEKSKTRIKPWELFRKTRGRKGPIEKQETKGIIVLRGF